LSQQLADNVETNLTEKQVEFANTINASGRDLLVLINEVLDLAKVESGNMAVNIEEVGLQLIADDVQRVFEPLAQEKSLDFLLVRDTDLPERLETDQQRLLQILRNLLSNAIKFTKEGSVTLSVSIATSGWHRSTETLRRAESVIAFAVTDTGIGIPEDKHGLVFQAFQQVDGGTSRNYGGTGLGLSISREIAQMLGGEIMLESAKGEGATFTLYLPVNYAKADQARISQARSAMESASATDTTQTQILCW